MYEYIVIKTNENINVYADISISMAITILYSYWKEEIWTQGVLGHRTKGNLSI